MYSTVDRREPENATEILEKLLKNYDIRSRPFGQSKYEGLTYIKFIDTKNETNIHLLAHYIVETCKVIHKIPDVFCLTFPLDRLKAEYARYMSLNLIPKVHNFLRN